MRRAWRLFYRRTEPHCYPPQWAILLVVAEDEYGDLWLPNLRYERNGEPFWDRPLNPHHPAHWPYIALTFLSGWIVMIESNA